jgi:hypothetical protein
MILTHNEVRCTASYHASYHASYRLRIGSDRIGWWELDPAARLGGADDPANMRWLTVEQHNAKTAAELRQSA